MTPIAEMVARLIEAGTPAALAAGIVAEAFAAGAASTGIRRQSADSATERRREYDRERQRKIRELRRQSADNPPTPQKALNLTSSSNIEIKKEKKVRAAKAPLSDDFQIKPEHFAAAEKLGIGHAAVLSKAEDMRLWAKSTGAVKVDWDATLHGFIRRDAEKLRENGTKRTVQDAAADLAARIKSFSEPPPSLCDGTGENNVRLLSKG